MLLGIPSFSFKVQTAALRRNVDIIYLVNDVLKFFFQRMRLIPASQSIFVEHRIYKNAILSHHFDCALSDSEVFGMMEFSS